MKIQITRSILEQILKHHANTCAQNSDASNTIEFEIKGECDAHLGSTPCNVSIKSNYSECNNISLITT